MRGPFVKSHPVLVSIGYLLILTLFTSLASSVSLMTDATEIQTMLIFTIGFSLSTLMALIIILKSRYSVGEYGISLPVERNMRGLWIYLPLILLELVPLIIFGLDETLATAYMVAVLIFFVAAIIHEEVYFRGLILKTASVKGRRFAIYLSAILFGVVHLGNLTTGNDLDLTILLIAYAVLFGLVAAHIAIRTGSLLVPIILHFMHNLVSEITVDAPFNSTLILVGVQLTVLFVYALYFEKKLKPGEHAPQDHIQYDIP